jgi:hypothetical protein
MAFRRTVEAEGGVGLDLIVLRQSCLIRKRKETGWLQGCQWLILFASSSFMISIRTYAPNYRFKVDSADVLRNNTIKSSREMGLDLLPILG